LAPYDSPTVGGGHNQGEYCEPRAAAYRSQYPDYNITWSASEGSDKDFFGHVTYNYHCEFAATPKARSFGLAVTIAGFAIGILALVFVWRRRRAAKA
jgi:hypothetical protein